MCTIEKIIDVAKKVGADAIHPGYGFLSENHNFSEACNSSGIVFVGPSPKSIELMGNKAQAKRIMKDAGVPCVPGEEVENKNSKILGQPVIYNDLIFFLDAKSHVTAFSLKSNKIIWKKNIYLKNEKNHDIEGGIVIYKDSLIINSHNDQIISVGI